MQYLPLVDFVELQRLVAQVDVNIVPLVQNVFTNCKSELKFFEASVVDTVTIAAPVYTYQYSIQNGETGFLCNPGEWYERLQQIYQHPKLGQQVAEKAKDYCLNVYTGNIFLRQICTAYDQFAEK